MDAALALCGVDALCYDVNEALSGWVLYGSARRGLITLLGTLFVFCVGRRCTVTALPAIICLRSRRGCIWWPGQAAVMLARAPFCPGQAQVSQAAKRLCAEMYSASHAGPDRSCRAAETTAPSCGSASAGGGRRTIRASRPQGTSQAACPVWSCAGGSRGTASAGFPV